MRNLIILHHIKEIQCEGVEWIYLALDRIQWWALVNVIMSLWVP
jgi:hypothetical protein